ncbi:hypothetical protein ACQUW0_27390, partial [Ralstonia pseudosolanacearum]|uniref:hypothetical protein n=1 Tax=Ralstonia pseudosolanacearum TaxID=1310165 RepID=UPI003D17F840
DLRLTTTSSAAVGSRFVPSAPNDFENVRRNARKCQSVLKTAVAGLQKCVLKLKQGVAGCESVFRI